MTTCGWCDEPLLEGDPLAPAFGTPHHWECGLRSVLGGLNHQMGNCSCCGGTEPPDPPNMTTRQAALAAVGYYARTRGLA